MLIRIILAAVMVIVFHFIPLEGLPRLILYLAAYLVIGYDILRKAWKGILNRRMFDENFLMAIATVGAFALAIYSRSGDYNEAIAVMLFYQIGELFQSYAVGKSRRNISALMDIRPDYANIEVDGKLEQVDPDEVEIGTVIVVQPGEKVPIDGVIIDGVSILNTSALTGESLPRDAKAGDEVISGCINMTGVLKIRTIREFGESTVSKILELVENSSSRKSKSENFITKFAKYYTPIVVITALILAIVPPLIIKDAVLSDWIYRALSFLVVSCPCALVISIPLSFFGGIGGASKMGVLIKGSNYLEALSNTEIVVFDKTGTLTKGVFEVQKVAPEGISKEELLEVTAYSEHYSNHPIAISIKNAYGREIDEEKIINTNEIPGFGIMAKIEDKEILVGNEKLMNENKISFSKCDSIGTILYVAIDKKYAGYIVIADKIKDDSKDTIKLLKKNNIKQTVMLTGDRKKVGEEVAKELGIDKVYTDLLPDGKVKKVEELLTSRAQKGKLIFVGDGINDAPVLAISDIGVAMGGLGSDAAIEAADVVIMTDEPSKLVNAIKLSKRTMRIVKENIIFAIFVKVLVLVLSALGVATMWEAVFADVGVSIIAIINALRALRIKRGIYEPTIKNIYRK